MEELERCFPNFKIVNKNIFSWSNLSTDEKEALIAELTIFCEKNDIDAAVRETEIGPPFTVYLEIFK